MKRTILICVAVLMLCIPLGVWWKSIGPNPPMAARLNDWGRLLGLTGFVLLFLQIGLGSRIRLIERGIGLDKLLGLHQIIGVVTALILFLHPVLILLSERASGYSAPFGWLKALGLITLLCLMVAVAAGTIGQRVFSRYETWVAIHRVAFVLLPLAFIHSFFFGGTPGRHPLSILWVLILAGFLAILFHRNMKGYRQRRHPHRVLRVVEEAPTISTLVLKGRLLDQHAGQFVIVRVEREGRLSEPHPFTIASCPHQQEIWLTIKAVGDFTASIREVVSGAKALLDGPYGVFGIPADLRRPLVFVAGGIGITPFLSMLRSLRKKEDARPITLLWANRTREDIFCHAELEQMGAAMEGLKVIHILSRDPQWPGEKGHITEAMLKRHLPAATDSLFLICGPPGFMENVRLILKRLGVPKTRISWERFSYLLFG